MGESILSREGKSVVKLVAFSFGFTTGGERVYQDPPRKGSRLTFLHQDVDLKRVVTQASSVSSETPAESLARVVFSC